MSSQLFLFCACALGLVLADFEPHKHEHIEHQFERFILDHGKSYAHEAEKKVRFQVFRDNLNRANYMNEKSGSTMFGITRFSDLTQTEFAEGYTGLKVPSDDELRGNEHCPFFDTSELDDVKVPPSLDWRDSGYVSPVKNQLTCGSCYAFSAIANIESQYAIKHNRYVSLSEQQIVDCDMHNDGCCGGYVSAAFKTLMEQGGPETDDEYPYVGTVQKCKFDERMVRVRVAGCRSYNVTCQDDLKKILWAHGPISVALKGSHLNLYKGGVKGIIDDDVCDIGDLNHAVLLVGYGEEKGKPYWILKNSWSDSWGEGGFFRVQRGPHAQSCGMINPWMASAIVE